VHFRPGWDCHGLPIELKVLQDQKNAKLTPLEVRRKARILASEAMEDQRAAMTSWGVAADWAQPYLTMEVDFVKRQMRAFQLLHERGFIFRR